MWVHHLIRVSTLSLVLTYAVCTPQPQSQLATLHERMNQMISELYSSPLLSKAKAALSSEETPVPPQEPSYEYAYSAPPAPQAIPGPPPSVLEPGVQSIDYAYPAVTNPVPRAAWPYPYEYSYQPHFTPPVYSPPFQRSSYPVVPYPEYARSPFSHIPQPAFAPTPVPSLISYPQFPPAQFLAPTSCPPSFSFAPSFPNSLSLRPPQAPYSPISSPSLIPHPSSCPTALPYPPSQFFPPPVPQHYTPPSPYPSHLPASYRASPYSPPLSYPQPMFQHMSPQSFPKPAEFLPQPQYEYSS